MFQNIITFSRRPSFFSALFVLMLSLVCLAGCSKTAGSKDGLGADGELSESDLNAQRDRRFGEGGIPTAEGEGMFRDVRFDYDSSLVNDIGRQNIEFNASVLRQNSNLRVQLEGHTDERGTAEYNLSLGQSRARAVEQLLISYGIPATRIETISYGEEVPLDSGHDEEAWTQNRRVHFSAFGAEGNRSSKSTGSSSKSVRTSSLNDTSAANLGDRGY